MGIDLEKDDFGGASFCEFVITLIQYISFKLSFFYNFIWAKLHALY